MQKVDNLDDDWSTNSSLDFLYAQEPKATLVNEMKRQTKNISNFIEAKIMETKFILPDWSITCNFSKFLS